MKINLEYIKTLNPCKDRLDNYVENYNDFDGSVKDFSQLSEITYEDKIWVLTKVATKQQRHIWGALCAQSVLHLFENKYPNDDRPRKAIENVLTGESNSADAGATATAADAYYAYAAASAAAASAASAAASDAAYAAAYAAAASAASAAASDAAYAYAYAADADAAAYTAAKNQQKQKNLDFLVNLLQGESI